MIQACFNDNDANKEMEIINLKSLWLPLVFELLKMNSLLMASRTRLFIKKGGIVRGIFFFLLF